MTGSSSKPLQIIQGKRYRERKQKKHTQNLRQKKKNYSTPEDQGAGSRHFFARETRGQDTA